MKQKGFAPILFLVIFLALAGAYFAFGKNLIKFTTPVMTNAPFSNSPGELIVDTSKYEIKGSEIIKTKDGVSSVLFKNVSGVSEIRLGPDQRTLHFKVYSYNPMDPQGLCADLESKIDPTPHDYKNPPPTSPPWDYKRLGYAYTINHCNWNSNAGGYLRNSEYFVYLKLTDATHGTLFYENLKTKETKNLAIDSKLLTGFNDGIGGFNKDITDRANTFWVNPIMSNEGFEYFYPTHDANIQDKNLILGFGTLILAIDTQNNKFIGGFPQGDVVTASFRFLGQKNLPFIVVESAWEGPPVFNEIIDITGGTLKTIRLYDLDKRSFFGFEVEPIVWESNGVRFNFTEFEEATDKLPNTFDLNKIGNESEDEVKKYDAQAEAYLINNYDYLEVSCSLGFGMFSGCEGLKKINSFRYTSTDGLKPL